MEKRRREGMSGQEAKGGHEWRRGEGRARVEKRRRESMSGEEAKGGGRER